MRNKNRRWLITWVILWTYLQLLYCDANETKELRLNTKNGTGIKETRGLFSPRMDYEQWKPILNGDPLKNDPTFDYVPPMVEAVRYWRDTSNRKSDVPSNNQNQNQKKDILLLGVSSKKPSTSIPDNPNRREYFDPFLKYVKETPYKESTYSYQRHRPHLPLTSPYFTPSQFLSKLTERPFVSNEAIPYTMLLPPPAPTKKSVTTMLTTRKPSPSSVTIDQSNLIFHSSTSGLSDWLSEKYVTTAESSNVVTWKTPVSREPILNNIIDKQEKPDSFISRNNSTENEEQIGSPVMHKGQVEDDELDIANTYVNIGKLEAHMDSVSGMGISGMSVEPPQFGEVIRPMMEPIVINPMFTPKKPLSTITMQTLETMQTMQPPPVPFNHVNHNEIRYNSIKSVLQNEITQPVPLMSSMFVTTMTSTTPKIITTPKVITTPWITTTPTITTTPQMTTTAPIITTPKPTTTTASSLTTDPLFKHYKQPMEPIRGPMYLIIQGHSKVKTYGPSKQIHGISIQESNEIPTSDDREFNVKHLHNYKKEEERPRRNGRSGNLQTLTHVVQTGLGALDFSKYLLRRQDDVQETEREVEYKVSSKEEDVTDRYLKGIVETDAIARKLMT